MKISHTTLVILFVVLLVVNREPVCLEQITNCFNTDYLYFVSFLNVLCVIMGKSQQFSYTLNGLDIFLVMI